jgi:hypothetical protein
VDVVDQGGRTITADRIVSATGFHADHAITSEIRADFDPITGAPRAMGPWADPNSRRHYTIPPHTLQHLVHPEQDFYTVGVKSFGRAPLFLLFRGYQQVETVVRALGG